MLCQPFVVHPLCTQNWVKFLLCILPCSTWISRAQRTLGGRQEASKSNYSRWQVHWLADWSRFSLSNLKLFLFFFGYLFFLLLHLPTADQTQNIDSRTRTLSSSASESSSSLLQSIWPPESKTMFNVEQAEREYVSRWSVKSDTFLRARTRINWVIDARLHWVFPLQLCENRSALGQYIAPSSRCENKKSKKKK